MKIRGKIHNIGRWGQLLDGVMTRGQGHGRNEGLGRYKVRADDLHGDRPLNKPRANPRARKSLNRSRFVAILSAVANAWPDTWKTERPPRRATSTRCSDVARGFDRHRDGFDGQFCGYGPSRQECAGRGLLAAGHERPVARLNSDGSIRRSFDVDGRAAVNRRGGIVTAARRVAGS